MTSTINSGTIKNEKATSEDRNKKFDHSLIIRGVTEDFKETEQQMIYKVQQVLSVLMHGDTPADRLECAKRMTIRTCR